MDAPQENNDPAKRRGKPPLKISQRIRDQVRTLAGLGLSYEAIADVVDISSATLKRRCKDDFAKGISQTTARVGQSLFNQAVGWSRKDANGNEIEYMPPSPAAAIFWMKCRAGWREKDSSITIDIPLIPYQGPAPADPLPIPIECQVHPSNQE